MPIVFVIGKDWTLRAGVRAELLEQGVEALGFETVEDASAAMAAGPMPDAIVLDAASADLAHPALRSSQTKRGGVSPPLPGAELLVVASALGDLAAPPGATVLRRPVRIAEIVAAVRQILRGQAA